MNLEQALTEIKSLQKENNKLQKRVDFLEELMHNEVEQTREGDYEDYSTDYVDTYLDKYR